MNASAVHLHRITQTVFNLTLILRRLHIDEIDDDQSTDVSNAQLTCDLVGRLEVGIRRRRLDIAAARSPRTIDVDRDKRFGVVDDDAAARGQAHLVSVSRLDLALDLEAGKERDVVGVHLQPSLCLRGHETLHVLLRFLEGGIVVYEHLADIVREVVAHSARDGIALAEDEKRGRAVFGCRFDLFPLRLEVIEVPLQFFHGTPDAGGTNDRTHAIRYLQLTHDLTHLVAVFALYAPRDATGARVVRHQYQEASSEADEGRKSRALGTALLLLNLNDEILALREQLADVHPPALRLLPEEVARDFLQRQKSVALRSVVDETGFERGFYPGDPAFVDVSFLLFAGG